MPFDPTKPAANSQISSAEVRGRLNALNTDKASHGDVATAIGGTANNVDGVGDLSLSISDPPTQWEVQTIVDKVNELLAALRRYVERALRTLDCGDLLPLRARHPWADKSVSARSSDTPTNHLAVLTRLRVGMP